MGRDQHCIGCFFFMVSKDKGRWKQQKLGNLRLRVGISRFSAQWHQFLCMLGIDSQSEFVIVPGTDHSDDDDDDDSDDDDDVSGDTREEVSLLIPPLFLSNASLPISNCSPIVTS